MKIWTMIYCPCDFLNFYDNLIIYEIIDMCYISIHRKNDRNLIQICQSDVVWEAKVFRVRTCPTVQYCTHKPSFCHDEMGM